MKSILVPTDFSPASYKAAHYAIALAGQFKSTTIILYNAYMPLLNDNPASADIIMSDNAGMLNLAATDINEFKNISEVGLHRFKQNLEKENNTAIEIKTLSDYNTLKNGIVETSAAQDVEMIVMPVEEVKDKLDEILIGSNALDVAKESKVPVAMVPAQAKFTMIKRILFACNFKAILATTPVDTIKKILDVTKAELFVLHVEADANDFNEKITAETLVLDTLLGSYNPQYVYAEDKDFNHAINKFVTDNSIDLVIAVVKKHSWFEGIFKHSHTKDLALHTHVPLITIRENA